MSKVSKEQLIDFKTQLDREVNLVTLANTNLLRNLVDDLLSVDNSSKEEKDDGEDTYAVVCFCDSGWVENTETYACKDEAFKSAKDFMKDYDGVKVYKIIGRTEVVFKEV